MKNICRVKRVGHKIWTIVLLLLCVATSFAQDGPKIKSIDVRGNVRVSKQAILSVVKSKAGDFASLDQLTKDTDSIRSLGWFSKVTYQKNVENDNNFSVIFEVAEYSEVREISFVGNRAIKSEELLKLVTFAPTAGASPDTLRPYNSKEATPTARAIQEAYRSKGFFARVESIAADKYNPSTFVIEIRETIIGSVTIAGITSTKQRVFNRLIKSRPGETYSRGNWERDWQRIVNTNWFEDVRPSDPSREEEDSGVVNLRMGLNDAQNGQFMAGLILDPRSSLAGSVGYSTANYQGTGQSISLNYQQPTIGLGGSASLSYSNPFIDSKDTNFQASIYDRVILRFNQGLNAGNTSLTDQYSERRTGGSISFSRPAADRSIGGVTARFERVNTPPVGTATLNFVQQDGEVAAIGFNKTWNSRDLDLDPSRGKFIRLDIEQGYSSIRPVNSAASPVGSFVSTKVAFDYRAYFTNNKKVRTSQDESFTVNAFRLRGGVVSGTVPFFEQFFAGGPDSIRGYFQDRFWGKYMAVGTYEYRKPVDKSFSLVAFLDYGGAWGGYSGVNDFSQSSSPDFKLSYGLGVRLRTKIGAIRIEYAFTGDGQALPVFMIGNNF